MRQVFFLFLSLWSFLLIGQAPENCSDDPLQIQIPQGSKPWSHLDMNNDPCNFQFAIVTDRTGGHRPGIFEDGVQKLNLLQPEFVMSVGDLIEGYTTDTMELERQWDEFDGFIEQLSMPFFYVPGNHDITNEVMEQVWKDRYGPTHYHFVYKEVLFLCLNTEDQKRGSSRGTISDAQFEYIRQTLAENSEVKWTLLFMHQPLWVQEAETLRWKDVEKLLADRQHTVFVGHRHYYSKFERNNGKYFMLATTGGSSSLRGPQLGEFDHVVWVTMTEAGPIIANLQLEGIWDENVATASTKKLVEEVLEKDAIRISPFYLPEDGTFEEETLSLRIRNDQDIPLEVKFQEGFSWDLIGKMEKTELSILPNSVEEVSLTIRPRAAMEPEGMKPLRLKVFLTYSLAEERKITIPVVYHIAPQIQKIIPAAASDPIIDGQLSDWNQLPYSFTPGGDSSDLHVDYGLTYSDSSLYFAVRVTDDEINTDTIHSVWGQDAVGFIVNGLPLQQSVMARGDGWYRNEAAIRISPASADMPSTEYPTAGAPPEMQWSCRKHEGYYVLEGAIPVKYLKTLQGAEWSNVRINILLDDFDRNFEESQRYFLFPDWRGKENVIGSGMFFKK